jgi:RNA polymerase sigma-70 factor (ECF subfamily)
MKVKYETCSDEQLTDLLNQEDKNAYKEIYTRYWPVLLSFAKRKVEDDAAAEDILQEVFIRVYQKMGSLYNDSLRSFLYKSVQNEIISAYRKTKVRSQYAEAFKKYAESADFTTDHLLRENELKRQIEKEVERLPPKMKAIFELSRKHYLTHQEIADKMKMPVGSVGNNMTHILKVLKSKLTCFLLLQVMSAILLLNKLR